MKTRKIADGAGCCRLVHAAVSFGGVRDTMRARREKRGESRVEGV